VKRDHVEKMRSSDADEAPRPHGNYTVTRNGPQRDIAGEGWHPLTLGLRRSRNSAAPRNPPQS
jgi:hypothetical protein